MILDGDDEDFLCTPETGRRCCHDNSGGVFGEPEGDGNPVGLKPAMVREVLVKTILDRGGEGEKDSRENRA